MIEYAFGWIFDIIETVGVLLSFEPSYAIHWFTFDKISLICIQPVLLGQLPNWRILWIQFFKAKILKRLDILPLYRDLCAFP